MSGFNWCRRISCWYEKHLPRPPPTPPPPGPQELDVETLVARVAPLYNIVDPIKVRTLSEPIVEDFPPFLCLTQVYQAKISRCGYNFRKHLVQFCDMVPPVVNHECLGHPKMEFSSCYLATKLLWEESPPMGTRHSTQVRLDFPLVLLAPTESQIGGYKRQGRMGIS